MSLSGFENIPTLSKRAVHVKDRVKSQLEYHFKRNPITSKELEDFYRLSGSEIRAIIHALRLDGCPIASGSTGYYWAMSYSELLPTVEHITQRISSLSVLKKSLSKTLYSFDGGQTSIL